MDDLRLCFLPGRRLKGEVQPEHGDDEQEDQCTLPPGRGGRIKAWVLHELTMLRDIPMTSGRLLLVIVVGGEGFIWGGGHGGGGWE
jgi:hypothetical protein